MKYNVITIGSASLDTFLKSKVFKTEFFEGKAMVALDMQKSILINEVISEVGGSATNAAVTFARQGLKTACLAKIGDDIGGREVKHFLKKEKISQNLVVRNSHIHTATSTYLLSNAGDSTRLEYGDTMHRFNKREVNLNKLKSHWFYISDLYGDIKFLSEIFEFAEKKKVKIAINPSFLELSKPRKLMKLIQKAEIVILNNENLNILDEYSSPEVALRSGREAGLKNIVITDGENGGWVLYNDKIYHSKIYKKIAKIDYSGTTDAYGSAFVCAIIKNKPVKEAISFASANATSVVHYVGSKAGILKKTTLKHTKISVKKIR